MASPPPCRVLMPTIPHKLPDNLHPPTPQEIGSKWFGVPVRFEVVGAPLEITGYQLYAVEKWIVERSRPVTTLTVYTGDPSHRISVTALQPASGLSEIEAKEEYQTALTHLRREGARPKETPQGTLLATSLARFRSDHTIVALPGGSLPAARDQLYANINLLRMGCGGRSAVTLEESSDTTKDRFVSLYHLPYHTVAMSPPLSPSKAKSKSKSHAHSSSTAAISASAPASPKPRARRRASSQGYIPPMYLSPLSDGAADVKEKIAFRGEDHSREKDTEKEKEKKPFRSTRTDCTLFNATVLELVKLVQAALSLFGMFPQSLDVDGLLCDVTVEGIQRWVDEVGGPCVGVEPMERVADPTVVAALLSLVLATRNKLAALGYSHVFPKDPFLHPHTFTTALTHYITQTSSTTSSASPSTPALIPTPAATHFNSPYSAFSSPGPALYPPHIPSISVSSLPSAPASAPTLLTLAMVESISAQYEKKAGAKGARPEGRTRTRKLLDKLDDLRTATDTGDGSADGDAGDGGGGGGGLSMSGIASGLVVGLGGGGGGGASAVVEATSDLGVFVKAVLGREREREGKEVGSVRALWSGRIGLLVRMREREREGMNEVAGRKERERDKERVGLGVGVASDGDMSGGAGEKTDGGTDDEEVLGAAFKSGLPWSGRAVQKKFEAWAGLSKPKKLNADFTSAKGPGGRFPSTATNESSSSAGHHVLGPPLHVAQLPSPSLPARDAGQDEELLSSGQVSPISDIRTPNQFSANFALYGASAEGLPPAPPPAQSEHDRRMEVFNQKRPPWFGKGIHQGRISSWSDPVSAWDMVTEDGEGGKRKREKSRLGQASIDEEQREEDVIMGDHMSVRSGELERPRSALLHGVRRRHSFHELEAFRGLRVLGIDRMRIDVELSGQLLIMRRREQHLESVLACLQALTSALSVTNASLREDHKSHQQALAEVGLRTEVLAQIEADRTRTDGMTQETRALLYESAQLHVPALWHMARPPRAKVLSLREKVFGTGGRRLPTGVHGAHGRFSRLQWTLDGRPRLVDSAGRTESEVEEERVLAALEDEEGEVTEGEEEEDAEPVEHPGIKPMWLLRLFTSWGARWGVLPRGEGKGKDQPAKDASPKEQSPEKEHSLERTAGDTKGNPVAATSAIPS